MKLLFFFAILTFVSPRLAAEPDTTASAEAPFAGMDLTWINGQNRQRNFPLTVEGVGNGLLYLDTYFNYNLAKPIDNTQTASATIGRTSEFMMNLASVGFEANYKNVLLRLWLQTGAQLNIVQELDGTVTHGRNTSTGNLKFIREAAAGYHFDVWHGLNVEMGIFMSYIGLESYLTQENWNYQRSMISEFTPFYFQGARIQAYPSSNYKAELWLLNGWQTYNSWNTGLGVGQSNYWRPNEDLQLVMNFYLGQDDRGTTRVRFHNDNSVVARYFKNGHGTFSQAAFCLNAHYGSQLGEGETLENEHLIGAALSHRLWFAENKMAVSVRADGLINRGLYDTPAPTPVAPNAYTDAIASSSAPTFNIAQFTLTFDVMPSDFITFRFEYLHRASNIPYFAGPGGTTSPDGWVDTPAGTWRPDLRTWEDRITLATNVRL